MKIKLTEEQLETYSYADVAFLILSEDNKKTKIQDLFKKVIKAMKLPDEVYESAIGDFFEVLLIDKRFIMLENGFCDLKIKHSTKIVIDEDEDEDLDFSVEIEETDEDEDTDINYDDNTVEDDSENDLENLVIIDEDDSEDEML